MYIMYLTHIVTKITFFRLKRGEMRKLNVFGSSHASKKHGFQQTMIRHYSQMEDQFKLKYVIGQILSFPGATYNHEHTLETF